MTEHEHQAHPLPSQPVQADPDQSAAHPLSLRMRDHPKGRENACWGTWMIAFHDYRGVENVADRFAMMQGAQGEDRVRRRVIQQVVHQRGDLISLTFAESLQVQRAQGFEVTFPAFANVQGIEHVGLPASYSKKRRRSGASRTLLLFVSFSGCPVLLQKTPAVAGVAGVQVSNMAQLSATTSTVIFSITFSVVWLANLADNPVRGLMPRMTMSAPIRSAVAAITSSGLPMSR